MRNRTLDAARALGIALMVLDHFAAVYEWPSVVRDFTRLAMPLFMVTSGYLFRGLGQRYSDVWATALLTWPAVVVLDVALFHVLLVYALVIPALCARTGVLVVLASLGLLQGLNWPIPWHGYQPGYLLAFLVLGRLTREAGVVVQDFAWPSWVTVIGRYPLTVYGGHLAVLVGLSAV